MTVKINADTSDGLKFVSDTSGEIDLQTNGTTKVHMGTDGKVGIGTTSPSSFLHVTKNSASGATDDIITWNHDASSWGVKIRQQHVAGSHLQWNIVDFASNNLLCFRQGQVLVGSTSQDLGERLHVAHTGGGVVCVMRTVNSGGTVQIGFKNANGFVGEIVTNGSGTSYATSSDYRLKENVSYTFDATSRLKQLKPARFNFKADADTTLDGFLAHEVSSIVPEAVIGEKDATEKYTDDDGKEQTRDKHQSIDQSKLVPLLVKTIQELEARITALES